MAPCIKIDVEQSIRRCEGKQNSTRTYDTYRNSVASLTIRRYISIEDTFDQLELTLLLASL